MTRTVWRPLQPTCVKPGDLAGLLQQRLAGYQRSPQPPRFAA